MARFPRVDPDKKTVKKGTWSVEEDEKLVAYIRRYGIWNWNQMAEPAGLARTGKSCRLRWMNYLRPNIRHGNFTKEEEDVIIAMHRVRGNRWAAIAARLHGRTDNEVKNYWNTRLKKRFPNNKPQKPIETRDNQIDSNMVKMGYVPPNHKDGSIFVSSITNASKTPNNGISTPSTNSFCSLDIHRIQYGEISDHNEGEETSFWLQLLYLTLNDPHMVEGDASIMAATFPSYKEPTLQPELMYCCDYDNYVINPWGN